MLNNRFSPRLLKEAQMQGGAQKGLFQQPAIAAGVAAMSGPPYHAVRQGAGN
jgi:hypothetical protein